MSLSRRAQWLAFVRSHWINRREKATMAKLKISDTLRSLNIEYDADLSYQRLYLAVAGGLVPAERDPSGRFWLIDETDQPRVARALGILRAKPKPKPTSKPGVRSSGCSRPSSRAA
jgi:hypothetical protein